jgi:hypothetical protein
VDEGSARDEAPLAVTDDGHFLSVQPAPELARREKQLARALPEGIPIIIVKTRCLVTVCLEDSGEDSKPTARGVASVDEQGHWSVGIES